MSRIVILGNSGSGKTSLAKRICAQTGCQHLDLDDVAWKAADAPVRESFEISSAAIDEFVARHSRWVIEGCYSSLIAHAAKHATQFYFLNIGVDACIENCRSRPWEPEKYPSKEAQDENLAVLIDWVESYGTRKDEFSLQEHRRVFENFDGPKSEIHSNHQAQNLVPMPD